MNKFSTQLRVRTYIDERGEIVQSGDDHQASTHALRMDVKLLHQLLPAVDMLVEAIVAADEHLEGRGSPKPALNKEALRSLFLVRDSQK